jgi:hypothetical protein
MKKKQNFTLMIGNQVGVFFIKEFSIGKAFPFVENCPK